MVNEGCFLTFSKLRIFIFLSENGRLVGKWHLSINESVRNYLNP